MEDPNKIEEVRIADLIKERQSERAKLKLKFAIFNVYFNKFIFWLKKNKWRIVTIILIIILINPTWSGSVIGQWINDFIGSILKNIHF